METLKAKIQAKQEEIEQINPSKIMQITMGFMASKVMLSAVNMGLFTFLAEGQKSGIQIQDKLGMHGRGLYDFLDTMVTFGLLQRSGIKETAFYSNSDETDLFLDKNKPSYIGGIIEMANNRLYGFWDNLEAALKTGQPQNELKFSDKPMFEELYSDPARLTEFIKAMGGAQIGNFIAFAREFDFSGYKTLCDVGGAGADLSEQVVRNNEHMTCISYDLPQVSVITELKVEELGLDKRINIQAGDFFNEEFPKADVITMGNILHDWGLSDKKMLIKKAFNALPEGGSLVVIENLIDENRSKNTFGLLMSLNMLIETPAGFDYCVNDIKGWVSDAGFKSSYVIPLAGPTSAFVAVK